MRLNKVALTLQMVSYVMIECSRNCFRSKKLMYTFGLHYKLNEKYEGIDSDLMHELCV